MFGLGEEWAAMGVWPWCGVGVATGMGKMLLGVVVGQSPRVCRWEVSKNHKDCQWRKGTNSKTQRPILGHFRSIALPRNSKHVE